jgi:membrane protease subunit (stomatin/prohibitin family)
MLGRDNQMAFDIFGNQKKEFKSANTARNTFYWPDNLKQSNIVWRLPSNVRWNDNIVVREDEFAVFLRDGKALCVFDRPDRYALTTENVPVLATMVRIITGVEQIGEIYWVQKREFRGTFGTSKSQDTKSTDTLTYRDVDFGLVRLIATGQFAYKITEPMLFITQFIGTKGLQHSDEIINWLKDQIMMTLNSTLGKLKKDKQMGVLDMPAYLSEIEQICLSKLESETQQYGMQVTKFSGLAISLPEVVQKAIDQRSAMSALGVNYMQLQTGQAIGGIGEGAAKGGGDASGFAGIGAGLGAGYAMSQAMTQSMNAPPSPMIKSSGTAVTTSTCQKCWYQINDTVKFCPKCGNSMTIFKEGEVACPFCKSRISSGVQFCPECGKKLLYNCPKCNGALELGAKFCQNCGEQIIYK